jgi:hypothetical protein
MSLDYDAAYRWLGERSVDGKAEAAAKWADLSCDPTATPEEREAARVRLVELMGRSNRYTEAQARTHNASYAATTGTVIVGWGDAIAGAGGGIAGLWVEAAEAALTARRGDGDELADADDPRTVDRLARAAQGAAGRWLDGLVWPVDEEVTAAAGGADERRGAEAAKGAALLRSMAVVRNFPAPQPNPKTAIPAWLALAGHAVGAWHEAELIGLPRDEAPGAEALARLAERWAVIDGRFHKAGTPWISVELGRWLRSLDKTTGRSWTKAERARAEERRAQPALADGWEAPVLTGWVNRDRWRDHWIGEGGREAARIPGPSHATVALALAVWIAEVRPEMATEHDRRRRTYAPALPLPFAVARAGLTMRVEVLEDRKVRSGGTDTGLALAPGVDREVWTKLAGVLHTLTGRRVSWWAARIAWEAHNAGSRGVGGDGWQATIQHDRSVSVEVDGGKAGLADVVGVGGKDGGGEAYAVLHALCGVRVTVEDPTSRLSGTLISVVGHQRGGGGRRGRVWFTLSPWWSPGAVNDLIHNPDRVIVPVLDVPPLDTITPQLHNLGATMEEQALIALATNAREVHRHGGVSWRWEELAERVHLRTEHAHRLIADWQERGRWEEIGSGRWMLGAGKQAAGDLIREAGKMREERARGGRAASAAKRGEGPKKRRTR